MRHSHLFVTLTGLFLLASGVLHTQTIIQGHRYKSMRAKLAREFSFEGRLLDPDEWLGQSSWEGARPRLQTLAEQKQKAIRWAWVSWGLIGGYLLGMGGLTVLRKDRPWQVGMLMIAAFSCLYIGIYAPTLEIAAFERDLDLGNIPIQAEVMGFSVQVQIRQTFEGDMYFFYQSKSVAELIQTLLDQDNYVVGLSILVFSALFPLVKGLMILWMLAAPRVRRWKWVRGFVRHSGKWSMADVFVVATFLGYLAFGSLQTGIQTESQVGMGAYFFLGYCLLSIVAAMLIENLPEYPEGKSGS